MRAVVHELQGAAQGLQAVARSHGQEYPGQFGGVDRRSVAEDLRKDLPAEGEVEADPVSDYQVSLAEERQLGHRLLRARLSGEVGVAEPRESLHDQRNRHPGVSHG